MVGHRRAWFLALGTVVLGAAIAIAVGLGVGGPSTNDKIVAAFVRTLRPDERSYDGARSDALDLAGDVCSSSQGEARREFGRNASFGVGGSLDSLETVLAVADVACPDIAAATRASQ